MNNTLTVHSLLLLVLSTKSAKVNYVHNDMHTYFAFTHVVVSSTPEQRLALNH